MSEIDQYRHQCIGIVHCPAVYPVVSGNDRHRSIPLYRLDEPAEEWAARQGDLLLGGGGGESPALRISLPAAIAFFTQPDWDDFESYEEIYKAYWSMTSAYIFGEGYARLGWNPSVALEEWLVGHVIAFVLNAYPLVYRPLCGPLPAPQDGSICRLPDPDSDFW